MIHAEYQSLGHRGRISVNEQREKRSNGWLAYVGYTRDKAVKADSIEQREREVATLQEKIDVLRKAGR